MKKFITSFAALICVATASSAEVVKQFDFEDGTYDTWKVWEGKTNQVLGANMASKSKHALEVKTGMYFDYHNKDAKGKYTLTLDAKHVWGQNPPIILVQYYDTKAKGLVALKEFEMSMPKAYETVTLKFKAKAEGYHRVTIMPSRNTGGSVMIDNVKLVKE
ncbi:MAG: hypothetical protein SNH13_05725 [Rikenellaceae bacterium]